MITRHDAFRRTYPSYAAYPQEQWIGRSGKAGWLPAEGPQYTTGRTVAGVPAGGAQWFQPAKPRLMMDPSDPSTWQRPYRFSP